MFKRDRESRQNFIPRCWCSLGSIVLIICESVLNCDCTPIIPVLVLKFSLCYSKQKEQKLKITYNNHKVELHAQHTETDLLHFMLESLDNNFYIKKKITNFLHTSLRIVCSKHQKASASFSRRTIIGEHISFIPAQRNTKIIIWK